jgi:DNA-binding CsgD family transcriptional regulator
MPARPGGALRAPRGEAGPRGQGVTADATHGPRRPWLHSVAMPATLDAVRCPLLIGREDLLELADRRLHEVATGNGRFLLLAGEAGIGKTRLLHAIRGNAESFGLPTATASVAPQDRDVPVSSILDLARTMTRLAAFSDLGGQLLRLCDTTSPVDHLRRRRLVMDIVDLILGSLPCPAMLAFEDLQWADDLSLEVIGELARRSADRPLLVIGDYRTEDLLPGTSLRDWRARLITQRIAEEVRLRPLSKDQTALATTLILDTGLPAPREVAAAVYERTDGIPLHIEELLGALTAEARADGTAIREATVPDTIDDAIIARIAHRSPEAQAAARAGAVIGRCFVPEVLAVIMDVPLEALEAPLEELADHMVLDRPGSHGGYYDFRHQLLRDVLYRASPASERRRFHARAGEFGAELEGASEIHASVHYERAGLHREAFAAAVAGGRSAVQLSAHREAFELYRRAVANAPDDLDLAERGALLEAYSKEAMSIEANDIAERMSHDARVAYLATGRTVKAAEMRIAELVIGRREARSVAERSRIALELTEEFDRLPPGHEREIARRALLEEWTRIHLETLSIDAAHATIATMREVATARGDARAMIEANAFAAMVDVLEGRGAVGLEAISSAAREAQRSGFEDIGVGAFQDAATLAVRTMDYGRAISFLAEGSGHPDAIGQGHSRHVMAATSALVAWAGADWNGAVATGRQIVADHPSRRAVATARWAVGYVALGRGDFETADAELAAALSVGAESGAIDLILPALWGLAESALLAGDPQRSAERCREALERARAAGEQALLAPFVVTGIRADHARGRPAEAEAWLAACVAHLSALPAAARPALDHGRGLVALAAGSTGVARQAFEAAIEGWEERGRVWEATWARLDLANCLTRVKRFADALDIAREARVVASRLDSPALAERADALQRMARSHVSVDEPWRPLTAREFAVARLITAGLTNAEIARELSIASKTASRHVEHILAKLGASRRTEIAAWASHIDRSPASR